MNLSQTTSLILARMFMQESFPGIPGPHTGIAILTHIAGMQTALERYRKLNGGQTQDIFTREVEAYLKSLADVADGILVLSAIPIAALSRLVEGDKKAE